MQKVINNYKILNHTQIPSNILNSFFKGYIVENKNSQPYNFINDLERTYPTFKIWFYNKIASEILSIPSSREILMILIPVSKNKQVVAGFAILKKTTIERKICTFRISNGYRGIGYGDKLMQECMNYLDTNYPLMTIPVECLSMFSKIIFKYHFRKTQILNSYYTFNKSEYVFNGYLQQ